MAELVGSCIPIDAHRSLPDPNGLFYPSGLSLCTAADQMDKRGTSQQLARLRFTSHRIVVVYFVLIRVVSTEFLMHLQSLLVCCGCDIVVAMTTQLAKETVSEAPYTVILAVAVAVVIVSVIVIIIIIYVVRRRRRRQQR